MGSGLILHWIPEQSALWHGDRSLVPAIEFWRELLEVPDRYQRGEFDYPGINQPMSVWVRMNMRHWVYSRQVLRALQDELEYRTGETTQPIDTPRPELPLVRFIRPPLVIPDKYWWNSVPTSHCLYYLNECGPYHEWSRRPYPWWIDRDMSEPRLIHLMPGDRTLPPMSKRIMSKTRLRTPKQIIREMYRGHHLVCNCKKPPCQGGLILDIANRTD